MTDKSANPRDLPAIRLLTGQGIGFSDPGSQPHISGKMQRALFVALAIGAGNELSRDWLADLLWPDTDQGTARKRLRMTLLNLRRSLKDHPIYGIAGSAQTLMLDIDPTDVDLLRVLSCSVTDDINRRQRTAALYTGDLLSQFPEISDVFDSYLSKRRADAHNHCLALFHSILRDTSAVEDDRIFRQTFAEATSLDPCDMTTAELGMRFWAARGRPDLVDQVFSDHANHLREALDADVSRELRRLRDSFSRQASAVETGRERAEEQKAEALPGPSRPPTERLAHAQKRTGLRWFRVAVATLGAACVLGFTLFTLVPTSAPGPVFLVRQSIVEYPPCDAPEQIDRHEAILFEALSRIDDGTILIGRLRSSFIRSEFGIYVVEHSVSCSAVGVRSTITVHERGTQGILVSLRMDGASADAGLLRQVIASHLPAKE